ncbi:flagellar motor switch protein FliM [soil metagenome]
MDDVQPFSFGRGDTQAPVMLSGLDRLGEKLGRRLRDLVEPFAGCKPVVVAQPVEVIDYSAWAVQVQPLSSIGVYRLLPLKGNILLRMDGRMISTLVDRFYGGAGNRPSPSRAEFTPTEDRIIARIAESFTTALVTCWADTLALDAVLLARETGLGFVSSVQSGDQMVLQRFVVDLVRDEQYPIDILFPLAALRAVEPLMGTKVHDEGNEGDPIWQARVERQMANIRLPARTVLARPDLPLSELMQLKPGDIIPVHINRTLPLIVGDRIIAHGSIGEQDGRAAFMIEKLS